jgi:hypothetical protein
MKAIPHCFMYQFCSYYTCAKKKDDFQRDISYFFSIFFLMRNGNAARKITLNIIPIIFRTVFNETNRTLRRRCLQLLGGLVIAPLIYVQFCGFRIREIVVSFLTKAEIFLFLSVHYQVVIGAFTPTSNATSARRWSITYI